MKLSGTKIDQKKRIIKNIVRSLYHYDEPEIGVLAQNEINRFHILIASDPMLSPIHDSFVPWLSTVLTAIINDPRHTIKLNGFAQPGSNDLMILDVTYIEKEK